MKQPSEASAKKKTYQSPKLLIYGNLIQMTQAAGKKGHIDGGHIDDKRRTGA
jgi:hypothetical protein